MVHLGPVAGLVGQFVLLGWLGSTVGLGPLGWLAGLLCAAITNALLARGLDRAHAAVLGPANAVTLARATLAGGVTALVADGFARPIPVVQLVALAALALVLDGVDGQVARRTGTASALGARFDMEVDAFLILVLSVAAARSAGWWVLAIGAARYAHLAAGWVLPWLRAAVPPRYWRKPVAAIQGIVLTVAVAHLLPGIITGALLVLAMILLAESFGRDDVWLWRKKERTSRLAPDRAAVAAEPQLFWVSAHE
jgi:phosphatidylglycerophosphate synthase